MAFETKEEIFEKVISQERPRCPHCGVEMSLWEAPDITIDDGLGWGTPYLFVCFNDKCRLYAQGWDNIKENYGRTASYRCICYPESGVYECMSVYGPLGGTGQIIDDKVIKERDLLRKKTEEGLALVAQCLKIEDRVKTLEIILDSSMPTRVRVEAAVAISSIGELDALDPLRNHSFGNRILREKVEKAITSIHDRFFTKECPYCAEIIKKQAKVCKYCGNKLP